MDYATMSSSSTTYSYSSSSSEEPVVAPKKRRGRPPRKPKKRRGRPPRKRSYSQIQAWGDYTLQFQDDKTGRKNIHPSALRFTRKLVEDLARDTCVSVAKSLQDDGELEESRLVQVHSSRHVKLVMKQVRKQLAEIPIPARYVRIEDLNLSDLPNQQRREEIKVNQKLAKKLEQQRDSLQKEYDAAKTQRDASYAKLGTLSQLTTTNIHPLLLNLPDETLEATNTIDDGYEEAKGPTLSDLLKTIPSPYDHGKMKVEYPLEELPGESVDSGKMKVEYPLEELPGESVDSQTNHGRP